MSNPSQEAFSALVKPHFNKLYSLAYRLTGSRADAEDLMQDVLIKLYERRAELSSIRSLAPWLGRVLYNQFIDDKRRYARQPLKLVGTDAELEAEQENAAHGALPVTDPSDLSERSQQRQHLSRALAKLSEAHRIVLLMHDVEGYKLHEIHELTDISVGTLKSRLSRARARLRILLVNIGQKNGTFLETATCSAVEGAGKDAL